MNRFYFADQSSVKWTRAFGTTKKTRFRSFTRMINLLCNHLRSMQRHQVPAMLCCTQSEVSCAKTCRLPGFAHAGRKFDLRERFAEAQLRGMSCCTATKIGYFMLWALTLIHTAAEGPSFPEKQQQVWPALSSSTQQILARLLITACRLCNYLYCSADQRTYC